VGGRIAGAHRRANLRHHDALRISKMENIRQRLLKIFRNVIAQRFERRNVNHVGLVFEASPRGPLK